MRYNVAVTLIEWKTVPARHEADPQSRSHPQWQDHPRLQQLIFGSSSEKLDPNQLQF